MRDGIVSKLFVGMVYFAEDLTEEEVRIELLDQGYEEKITVKKVL
jgi:hypothetical protein